MKYTFLLLLLPFTCFAQKLITNTDKLSGTTTYLTSPEKIYSKAGEMLDFTVSRTNAVHVLFFAPTSGKINLTEIDSSNKTFIKYTDGRIDTLHTVSAKMLEYQPGSVYRMVFSYYLTDSQYSNLKSKSIALVRIETNDRPADYDIPDKNSQLIQKALALLP
jgi:hypothetical protein